VVVGGRKYQISSSTKDTKAIMDRLDNHVEVIDPKQRTGVVDIATSLFADLNWSKGKASVALKQAIANDVPLVSLEFLPA
ncbi:MAG: hypothetical protein ACREEJ_01125, partial [Ensifer adhaerens]